MLVVVAVEVVVVVQVLLVVVDSMENRISSMIVGASTVVPANRFDLVELTRLRSTGGRSSSCSSCSGTIFVVSGDDPCDGDGDGDGDVCVCVCDCWLPPARLFLVVTVRTLTIIKSFFISHLAAAALMYCDGIWYYVEQIFRNK